MAAIVFDGKVGGGNLFEGMKFWVAQRIPTRSRFIELIMSNGGQVVNLEKLADVIIADHARKDIPPGSYSWKYIEDSVKKGRLENLEDYRAGPAIGMIREVGSARPPKASRTTFTAADDHVLAIWVTKAEKGGISTKGNTIYQQLAQINSRHTFQSWRDRWVKYLQYLPRPDLSAITDSGPHPEKHRPNRTRQYPAKSQPVDAVSPASAATESRSQTTHKSPKPSSLPRRPLQHQPFTEKDTIILLGEYDDIINIDESKLTEAWDAFAAQHPQHTAHEWYQFWLKEVEPIPESRRQIATKTKTPKALPEEPAAEFSLETEPAKMDSSSQRASPLVPATYAGQERLEPPHLDEADFEIYLKSFAAAQSMQIELHPVVSGQVTHLFDLWHIVNKPEYGGFDNVDTAKKWGEIASLLGFDNSASPSAAEEVRAQYEAVLADFSDAVAIWRPMWRQIMGDDGVMTEKEAFQQATQSAYNGRLKGKESAKEVVAGGSEDELEIPSSPPPRIWPSGKRDHPVTNAPASHPMSTEIPAFTPQKRRRIDKQNERLLEIPSTPEERLIFKDQASDPSPSADRALSHIQDEVRGIFPKPGDIIQQRISQLILQPASKNVHTEPETQDFRFSYPEKPKGTQSLPGESQKSVPGDGDSIDTMVGSSLEDSSAQPEMDYQQEEEEIRSFIDRYIALGYSEEIVTRALLATTLETGDVATVMEAILQGAGIPSNIEGVWTEHDDQAVRLVEDREQYHRVVAKHGEARCVKRRQFLSEEVLQDVIAA